MKIEGVFEVAVKVKELAVSTKFYQDLLGFKIGFSAGRGMLPRPQGFGLVQQRHRRQNVSDGVTYPVTRKRNWAVFNKQRSDDRKMDFEAGHRLGDC